MADEVLSGVADDLFAVSAVDWFVGWAAGAHGAWVRVDTSGAASGHVPDAEALDFHFVAGFGAGAALVATGDSPARCFRTDDAGSHWREVGPVPSAIRALAFSHGEHGYAVADPVGGRFVVLETNDGGSSWQPIGGPAARPGEMAGNALAAKGESLWVGTRGSGARVLRSADRGRTWTGTDVPGNGVTSIAFFPDEKTGVLLADAPGTSGILAATDDRGATWSKGPSARTGASSLALVQVSPTPRSPDDVRVAITAEGGTFSTTLDDGDWTRIGDSDAAISFYVTDGYAVGRGGRLTHLRSYLRK